MEILNFYMHSKVQIENPPLQQAFSLPRGEQAAPISQLLGLQAIIMLHDFICQVQLDTQLPPEHPLVLKSHSHELSPSQSSHPALQTQVLTGQVALAPHVPQLPPHPSFPHSFPVQSGTQTQTPSWQIIPEAVQ